MSHPQPVRPAAPPRPTGPPRQSPWMTTREAADYARRHKDTVLEALRTGELRGSQPRANCSWRVHVDDIDAWMRGDAKTKRRLRSA